VFDKVNITYRGARYEIGRARDFYGIWPVGGVRSQPLQWWPETSEGWSAAWIRFTEIEAPGTIVPVGRRTPPVPLVPAQVGGSPAQVGGGPSQAEESAAQVSESPVQARESDAVPQVPAHAAEGTTRAVESPANPVESPALAGEETGSIGAGWVSATGEMHGAPALAVPLAGSGASGVRASGVRAAGVRTAGVRTGGALTAAALLGVGVTLGIAGLFPGYLGGKSLAQHNVELIPHAIYLATWIVSAVLIGLGGTRLRLGALLGMGISVVTFGLFFADAGTAMADGAHVAGWGLWLALAGWLACAAGSVLAFGRRPASAPAVYGQPPADGRLTWRRPRGAELGPVVMLVLAGLGVAAAFAPAWDSYTLQTGAGQSLSYTAGNAFSNPGFVIAGDVAAMVGLAAMVIVAALWRPARHGAVLLAGAAIPMAAQAISALVQVAEPVSSAQFGFTPAQATQLGLTIHAGVTPAFWVYCGFLVALVVSGAWLLFTPHAARGSAPWFPARDTGRTTALSTARSDGYTTWNPAASGGTEATSAGSPVPAGSYSSTSTDSPASNALGHKSGLAPGRHKGYKEMPGSGVLVE
jgi:hypothetical protein